MRNFSVLLCFIGALCAQGKPRGISISNLHNICSAHIAVADQYEELTLPASSAIELFRTYGGSSITRERMNNIERSAREGRHSVSLFYPEYSGAKTFEGAVPSSVVRWEHKEHRKARGSTQNTFFALELTLTILVSAALKVNNIDLTQLTGIPFIGGQYTQIAGGGALSRWSSGVLAHQLYGYSYGEFVAKVVKAAESGSTKPLSYGHGIDMEDSPYRIEILYFTRDGSPGTLVHVFEHQRL